MHKKAFSRNIAQSLTLGAWSKQTVETCLLRRLPDPLHRLAAPLSLTLLGKHPTPYAPTTNTVATTLLTLDLFDRIIRYCTRRNIWPAPDLTSPTMAPIAVFAHLDLPQLATIGDLADWLFLPVARLDYLADLHNRFEENGETAINHYHYILRPKKNNGIRLIEAPKQSLKTVQRQILRQIIDKIPDHPDAFGFVQGRNCLMGAARHANEEIVVCFDLQDFFPAVSASRVFGMFRCLGYPYAVARMLTALCTIKTPSRILTRMNPATRAAYAQPHLPQGAPASPALANKATFALDMRLAALAKSLSANYSRYADDVSFSGDRNIAKSLLNADPKSSATRGSP